ncbi:MAG: nickel-dependent hydrogenase large subunit [Candidatus Thiodiazotropha lotti]|uniref:Uptake hydrogenase large subunit n=1 Tax=Candidatus Thiodiazotropha endoloripes TaxID=1818881 RepID=A0A1E2UT66_9GAMM|nr:nickel-dependent hydrogenase large subunit [Candidatus Thiodiazotropha endoloripes]MCG7898541.1 nickel-dependent hydrogenase large subunit [Candidatus Thiodiazotropha weberae]MCG7990830.1 nickel-dependent hydrogenase large subunit [Candidatus Thiodiazotropha lotti]MCG7901462.1 nickel-dependent hydrogenase large subunit [Candidatus Thiodiazotropha weberae]MCG7913739.1 nickel-dependent hydrogenase large subunit [Candidatus Thiodiazotropha weberae]MCG7999306.1 nickel-dependent hydrogenase larg
MSDRIVVDPITRIEGHLRIEAQMEGDQISSAYSSGTMVRGIEIILKGRDPRDAWAFAQRICGVCTLVHGLASVRSVEDALNYQIPQNAQLIRNLMIGAQYIHDHVMHFYHLHALDWVDVVSALSADPGKTAELAQSLSNWPKASPGYFSDVKKKLKGFVEAGQLGIFAKAYWGHSVYKLPPEANLMAVAHYLEALSWQRDVVKLHAIFGGKNPHPNFLVGGVASAIDLNSDSAINTKKLSQVQDVITKMREFTDQVYVPDTLAVASFYKDWGERGEGLGNFLCYGDLPGTSMDDPDSFFFPSGVILDRDLSTVHPLDLNSADEIQEHISHSWYDYSSGKDQGLHPYDGETNLNYTGPELPYKHLNVEESYSWLKAPRWKGKAVEVGPLARVLMLYAKGHEQTKELVGMTLSKLDLPARALFSTLGRTAARTLETKLLADAMQGWYDQLVANIKAGDTRTFNEALWDPSTWPSECRGVGFMEAPRGALGHWIVIEDGKIANYQAVVPSTWNAGPRDPSGQPGAYEAALQDNHQLADAKQPVEILRTIHSFDPCIACAVHLSDEEGEEMLQLKVT